MNYLHRVSATCHPEIEAYRQVRAVLPRLARELSDEDLAAQSQPSSSPGKWHLAHTSWFFEAMILSRQDGYRPVDERLNRLFNSYYEGLGARVDRVERGLMTRPSREAVMAYRAEIDRRMEARLAEGLEPGQEAYLFDLALNHEQQHQELFLMDILHLFSRSPLRPAAYAAEPRFHKREAQASGWVRLDGGLVGVGAGQDGFAFDIERPRHREWLEAYQLAAGLVTNAEWIAFIDDGGYQRPELWLSDGWSEVQRQAWSAPLYWQREEDGWYSFGLAGYHPVQPQAPVRHVSYYEADAFARWSGKRLPTEAEWEAAAQVRGEAFSNLATEVWQWTASAYRPYPGFAPTPGTAGEYNGKFMANQMVLRGGAFATPGGHARPSYRNFYYPHERWMFSGVRLACDVAEAHGETDGFRDEMIMGLSQTPKAVSPKWFYDAEGSRLFEEITRLAEYYPTRQEAALLRRVMPLWAPLFGPGASLLELGSGASEKTRIVLDAVPDLAVYAPLDISPSALDDAALRIRADYPNLRVMPVVADFENLPDLPDDIGEGRRIGFFPGSTIGNLSSGEALYLLQSVGRMLGPGSLFILGVDLIKAEDVLVRAYDDAAGVTAAFNRNLLARANRELGTDFDLDGFDHEARWNPTLSRMEMHLVARRAMTVSLDGHRFEFAPGESLHTESSRKFDEVGLRTLVDGAGWHMEAFEVSPDPAVALALLSR